MYGLGSFFGTTCCCGNSREETKGNEITVGKKSTINRQEKQNHSKFAQDDPLSNLPNKVRVDVLMPFLDIESLAHFSQTSKERRKDGQKADEFAGKQLPSLKEELNELITNSGITGIQNPEGPFKNSIHQLRVLNDFKDAIRVLRGNGITDINLRDQDGNTPLHLAAINGQTETVRALIELGADVNLAGNFRATPLHEAARHGHTETVQALIDAKAVMNLADNFGVTPLYEAARHGHTEIVQALIDAKAVVNLADNFGFTPLDRSAINGHTEIIEILRTAQSTQGFLPPSCSIM